MPRVAGFDFWVPPRFRQVRTGVFEGADGLVDIDIVSDGGLVDFALLGPEDQLWALGSRVVAEVQGPRHAVTLVVSDRVWLEGDDFGLSQVRCTYASRSSSFLRKAIERVLKGASRLKRDSFVLDEFGHLAFGPIPVPGKWFGSAVETEELLFGGGFLEFGGKGSEAGFDLLLLPSEVRREPIELDAATRSAGMAVDEVNLWGCSAWRGVSVSSAVVIFRDPLGYAWRAEYRRGGMSIEQWSQVCYRLARTALEM